MLNWMEALAKHYQNMRHRYEQEKLILLFDIDGTILDMRYMMAYVLKSWDLHAGTSWFRSLSPEQIQCHEDEPAALMDLCRVPGRHRTRVLEWYRRQRWTSTAILESHRSYPGVLEVIRWFQMQPDTEVGLNTGRPECLRFDTLECLNRLGEEYRVQFEDRLLHMNPYGWNQEVSRTKASALDYFSSLGYVIFAVVDNEPDNLSAMAARHFGYETLFLHAATIFKSNAACLPPETVRGENYDLAGLAASSPLPRHIQFIQSPPENRSSMRRFLESNVSWVELPGGPNFDKLFMNRDLFVRFKQQDKKILLRLDGGIRDAESYFSLLEHSGVPAPVTGFSGKIDPMSEADYRFLADAFPDSILECEIDFLCPLIVRHPAKARGMMNRLRGWGINRFALDWNVPFAESVFDQLKSWGCAVRIFNVPGLEAFLRVLLLQPDAVQPDFTLPAWYSSGARAAASGKSLLVNA